jgi:tetratricopeptide (TPR) repeat protein
MPLSLVSLMVWILIMGAGGLMESETKELRISAGESNFNVAPIITVMIIAGVVLAGGWWSGKFLLSQIYWRNSLVASSKNDAGATYDNQIKAIKMMPEMAGYRSQYAQINMGIATMMIGDKKELSDDDKQKVSVLLQQAANEAKTAVSLDQSNPIYWSNLGGIYKGMAGMVEGAGDWAVQAYTQAAALDPANPGTKLELGGLYYAGGKYEEAERVFEGVVMAKSDWANGWYNWAYAAKKLNKLEVAAQRLSQAVALVPTTSGDYEKASKELEEWNKELAAKTKTNEINTQVKQPETLKTAQPIPTVGKEERVSVPANELAPPITPTIIPSITPQMTPVPTR